MRRRAYCEDMPVVATRTPIERTSVARVLVTGASGGLGLLTARSLREAGHEVVVHARTPARWDDPVLPDAAYGSLHADLAHTEQVVAMAEAASAFGPYDAVIHNAGVLSGPDVLAVNVVAPFVLSALMARPARVIVLSSSMHRSGSVPVLAAALEGQVDVSYSDSKLLVTTLVMALARRWPGVACHAVDPGWVPTRMGGPSAPDDLTEGHRTQEWLATADTSEIRPATGGYWHHRRTSRPHRAVLDERVQDDLIEALEKSTGLRLAQA